MIRRITRCSFAGSKADSAAAYISVFPDFQSYHNVCVWGEKEDEETGEPDAITIIKEEVQNWSLDKKLLGILLPPSMCHTDISGFQKNLAEHNYLVRNNLLSLPCIVESLNEILCSMDWCAEGLSNEWFKYMTCSPLRTEKYEEILLQLQINRPTFGSQKWYLNFYSLETALQFNKVFPNPEQIDSRSYPYKPSLQVTEDFCNIARLVYDAIQVASSPRNATLNSNFHTIWNLKIALTRSSEKAESLFHHDSMKKRFDEFWEKWYVWLCLAVVLDPRYKIRFLDRSLKEAFGSDAKKYMLEVRGKICELFFRYSIQVDQQGGECSNDSNSNTDVPVHEGLRELNSYLEGECVPENVPFDILKWWKGNASTYPTLALLARDILRIPACVVSAESAFDETDERVSLFNRKLSPEVVEALICTQDWIKSSGTSTTSSSSFEVLPISFINGR
jgi:hypothetical protein